jgi:hypothetical protein
MKLLAAIVVLMGLAPMALAQQSAPAQDTTPPSKPSPDATEVIDRQTKGRAGRNIRLVVITNVRSDCTSGPLPTVRLATPPKNGKVTVQRVRYGATNLRQCLAAEVPALVAFYRSANDFEGSDTATLEIRFEGKPPQLRRYTISVTRVDNSNI